MESVIAGLPLWAFALACLVTLAAGFVKGAVGFAMPLIMIAVLPSFMPVQTALAAVILPVLATNLHQSLRQGVVAAAQSGLRFWRIIVMTMTGILITAPFVVVLPQQAMFLLLGIAVLFFAGLQLSGWAPDIPPRWKAPIEMGAGLIGGLYGGISGIWGPPSIVYLLAAKVEKTEMIRVMSVIFTMGAVVLTMAHLRSGVLNARTAVLSAAMLVPAGLGMAMGYRVQDRLDPVRFKRWMLILLALSALNLLRRGLMG
ncbi:MAG: sulfite exporter TauE/SafE family protein [Rhodobacter sp.]|uniref:sulfite exporter TauE/SafE family protein n=1 Tax=Pararhodobacter sp. TaxID=2127056 RepID=UPI001DF8EC9F|nr:sulfite exporter TauE/SafE family protein [Pararhodobacter sp.]MCB1345307.1 sulfite exporter TauE/SafE family protein [Paracoccaceae bacterium]MCB1409214.1 sulfite exporter TauE/SafE family protein [Paracoccaceae bacterium]MCC0072547.1 sulfite exporter TauE/SafE family protein [Rhodobacter sp.]HPD94059.1 sulfite exporter TauE/SafE family protein [Pararhodobacter sp.]